MAARTLPDSETLRQLLDYNPDTGILRWKERGLEWFSDRPAKSAIAARKSWNTRYAGQRAFAVQSDTYLGGTLFKKAYAAHQIIWRLVTGEKAKRVDHINGDTLDNRICNLRNVTPLENNQNCGIPIHNTSGYIGVSRGKVGWRAVITVNNEQLCLGTFPTMLEAVAARKGAEKALGFHPNHGSRPSAARSRLGASA